MSKPEVELPTIRTASLLILCLLFLGSGCAALIYEIVWFQLLQLVIGSTAVSLGVLLGTFMGGMCLGSILLPHCLRGSQHPLRVYASLEAGIGVLGILVLLVAPHIARVYSASIGHGFPGILLRGAVAAICLLPPTVLMGATLPAISRSIGTSPREISWLGIFYGGNIAGAVLGCLLAGFYLLRIHDTTVATFVAGAINAAVALIAFALASSGTLESKFKTPGLRPQAGLPGSWPVYVTIALSGFCALSAEVVWTRVLSLMLGPTVYTFSIILAVFLVGLGIGSGIGSLLARSSLSPRMALGACQGLLAAAIFWTAWMIARSLPFWPIDPSISPSPWFDFQLDLVRCFWALLPPTILWGASFPLALAAVAAPGQDPGRLVGGIYAANTVGAILGALISSLLLIAWVGTQQSQRMLIMISAAAALLILIARSPAQEWQANVDPRKPRSKIWLAISAPLLIAIAAGLMTRLPAVPGSLIAHGRFLATKIDGGDVIYAAEGMNASVAVTELDHKIRNFHVSGKIEASTEPKDMRLQRMLGHIPALFHRSPRSVLVVGCGAGVTAGSFVTYPGIQRIVICEIEPLIPPLAARFFGKENHGVINDPRVEVIHDDARHYILTTPDKFDIITSDPIHPWVKGAATLYTQEYFELCKQHLNPGGFVSQWVPLYESTEPVVQSEIATFFGVFPDGTIWSNDQNGSGYDVVLLGTAQPMQIDADGLQDWLQRDEASAANQSLKDVGFSSVAALLSTYAGRAADLTPWLQHAEINRDRNLRLQYLAGLESDRYQSELIFSKMIQYRKFPEGLLTGSDRHLSVLRLLLTRSKPDKTAP